MSLARDGGSGSAAAASFRVRAVRSGPTIPQLPACPSRPRPDPGSPGSRVGPGPAISRRPLPRGPSIQPTSSWSVANDIYIDRERGGGGETCFWSVDFSWTAEPGAGSARARRLSAQGHSRRSPAPAAAGAARSSGAFGSLGATGAGRRGRGGGEGRGAGSGSAARPALGAPGPVRDGASLLGRHALRQLRALRTARPSLDTRVRCSSQPDGALVPESADP